MSYLNGSEVEHHVRPFWPSVTYEIPMRTVIARFISATFHLPRRNSSRDIVGWNSQNRSCILLRHDLHILAS